MAIGEARRGAAPDLAATLSTVPVLSAARPRTRRRLAATADELTVGDGAVVLTAGRAVRWVTVVLEGEVRAVGHAARWGPGDLVGVAEALTHGVAPETAVANGPCRLAFVELRALTAAVSTDPVLGLALARHLARPRGEPTRGHRPRRFERRRPAAPTRAVPA